MLTRLLHALRFVGVLSLLAALGLTIGLVTDELMSRSAPVAADQLTIDSYPTATPSACQAGALDAARAQLPALGITWSWARIPEADVLARAFLPSRHVVLDPEFRCDTVTTTTYHEWMHVASTEHYGGARTLRGEVVGDSIDPDTGRPWRTATHEVVADCGAALLADHFGTPSDLHVYADRAGGCTPDLTLLALDIVHAGGMDLPGPAGRVLAL